MILTILSKKTSAEKHRDTYLKSYDFFLNDKYKVTILIKQTT